jgi:hypothetical protein
MKEDNQENTVFASILFVTEREEVNADAIIDFANFLFFILDDFF